MKKSVSRRSLAFCFELVGQLA